MTQNNDLIYIALGANLSNPNQTFRAALADMTDQGIQIQKVSSLWQSPAWPPGSDAPDYLNAVASVRFEGSAGELLSQLQAIEFVHGRVRSERNAPRTLDLDILDFRGMLIDLPDLMVPHPRMLTRGFVLFPLEEVAPEWRDPIGGLPVAHHIAALPFDDVKDMKPVNRDWAQT